MLFWGTNVWKEEAEGGGGCDAGGWVTAAAAGRTLGDDGWEDGAVVDEPWNIFAMSIL